jgi:Tol biopolymer transport system component
MNPAPGELSTGAWLSANDLIERRGLWVSRLRRSLLVLILAAVALTGCGNPYSGPDRFGIYTARLDGSDWQPVLTSANQQMSHPRVSPDQQWITFTRYNRKGLNGLAEEKDGYLETEIMVARVDGSQVRSVVPPKNGVIAANSSWTPDGRGLVYLTTDTPGRQPEIRTIDLASGRVEGLPTPPRLRASDPHLREDLLAFPVVGETVDTIWTMQPDGTQARQITAPSFPSSQKGGRYKLGDYDPRISPDGTRIAFMRHFGGENWHVVVVDRDGAHEQDLSPPVTVDALPDWSGDGRLLIFMHVDRKHLADIGLYAIKPDGSERRRLPLPHGYVYGHSSFFPQDGSGPRSRIVFAATRNPAVR